MKTIGALLFDWLFNASVQIGLFAVLAAMLSPFIAKAKAAYQHCLYLAIFFFCLAAPVFNTIWQARPIAVATTNQKQATQVTEHVDYRLWPWNWNSKPHGSSILEPGVKTAFLAIWQVFFLYQLTQFSRGIYRIHRLRRDALSISAGQIGIAGSTIQPPHNVDLLESTAIDDPVTVGLFRPAIILPSKVIPALDEPDLAAVLAHEYGHIHRKDFPVHVLCQLTSLPVAWHPGIRYLMAKISQTRELACDDYAAVCLGKRISYARTLLRLASLCLQVPRGNAMGLGIFDGDNLEDRIMMLTEKRTSLSRAGLVWLAFTTACLFGSTAVLARAVSLQEASASSNTGQTFGGTWHWMFHGQSFATMVLVQNGPEITGTVTPSRIALNDDGELSRADPSDNSTPAQISKATPEGKALHVTVADGFEFIVTLKDATHAEIHPVGAPPNMKPIQAERIN